MSEQEGVIKCSSCGNEMLVDGEAEKQRDVAYAAIHEAIQYLSDKRATNYERVHAALLTLNRIQYPERQPLDGLMQQEDLQTDVYRTSAHMPVTVRVLHKPTGLFGEASHPSQLEAKATAYAVLRAKLVAFEKGSF